ncbi:MAG: DNA polymerase I, partial [bacterium]|nr:DNA polymerase I [bacterium]
MKKIAVIDGNSLMHRGYHAVPDYMTADDGTHTNAIFGFLQMLLKMNEKLRPDAIICAFDAGIPEFRKTAIERYKAQRPPTDPALKEQFPLIENILRALNIPVIKVPGWEGDDILGTISRLGEEQGMEVLLVSGDRDIFQLASELTKVVHTKTGMSDVVVYGPDEVRERYGIGPELVPDFISLKGDSSDNIPGVAGIGEKTAAKLLKEYGSVHEIVAHADELKGKQRESIKSSVEEIDAGLLVATIVRDVEGIDVDLDAIRFPSYTPADIREAFMSIKMTQHYSKFLALVEDDGSGDGASACPTGKVEPGEVLTGAAALAAVEEFIADGRE